MNYRNCIIGQLLFSFIKSKHLDPLCGKLIKNVLLKKLDKNTIKKTQEAMDICNYPGSNRPE